MSDLPSVEATREALAEQLREWRPGDPCATCGSASTGFDPAEGAFCNECGSSDADE